MHQSLPPLNWLRSFEAAARNLSFTAAADELNLTQSAISQQVRSLEVRLGVELFTRKARGLSLTDDGRKLMPKVSSALEMLTAATRTYNAGSTDGLLTIASSVSVAQWLLMPKIGDFLEKHPNIRIRFLSTIWPDDFKTSIADVEIRFGSEKQVGHNAQRLMPDSLIAVAAPDHVSADGELDLTHNRLIEAVGTSEGWKTWAQESGYSLPLHPTLHVDSYGAALDLAVNGVGVALTSSFLSKTLLESGKLIQLHPAEVACTEGYFLAFDHDVANAKAFKDWLVG